MTFSVTAHNVSSLKIGDHFHEGWPCPHTCTITLTDGRERKVSLNADVIYALINAIATDKITGDKNHFNEYKDFDGADAYPGRYENPIPEKVLSQIFSN